MSDATPPDEFDVSLQQLCAGFNTPCTDDRRDAYRRAFGKLSPILWDRMIDWALGEDGFDRMPSVAQMWKARKEVRGKMQTSMAVTIDQPQHAAWHGDHWDEYANRRLLGMLVSRICKRGKIADDDTRALVAGKNAWAADMRDLARNKDPDDAGSGVPSEIQMACWRDLVAARMPA